MHRSMAGLLSRFGFCFTLITLLPGVAPAQVSIATPNRDDMAQIVVTGSRIARPEFEYASPVAVFDASDLQQSGATSIDEFLKEIPAFTGFQYGTSTNNGNNGVKMVDLRGLGVKRTLVLINGRRQVGSFVGGPHEIGAVDLNTVPMFMLDRVEVLKDGASTIYGSDALGGVVNLITKSGFNGAEINFDLGYATEDWDAKTIGMNGIIGTSSERGWIMAGVGYQEQREMKQAARDWAQYALWPLAQPDGTFRAEALGSGNSRKIRGLSDGALAQIPSGDSQFIIDEDTGLVRAYDPATDSYNYAPVNALVTPNETWNLGVSGEFNVLEDSPVGPVTLFAEAMYSDRESAQRWAPDASFATDLDFQGSGFWNDHVPASNPYNPFGNTPNNPWNISGENVRVNRRFEESGGRIFEQDVDTIRIVTGLKGEFKAIKWDASYLYADNDETQLTKFYHRFDRWATMVDPALCAADPACAAAAGADGVLNPFAPFGTITTSELGYLFATPMQDETDNRLESVQVNLNGEFGALEGGAIGWAAGYEHRRESASYSPDPFSAAGLTTSGANSPLSGSFSVDEFYGELLLPLLAGRPFAKALNLEASVRHSDYDTTAGSETTYRTGLDWAINDEVRIRTAFSTGFRAPNIVELFGGNQTSVPVVEDPCEFYNRRAGLDPQIIQNCIADGFPTDFEWGEQPQTAFTQLAGSPLEPEESDNFTIGVVWQPAFLPNFTASIDYWSIEVDGYIDAPDYSALLFECYRQVDRSTAPQCSYFISGLGGRDSGGWPDAAEIGLLNLGELDTSGIDFAFDYSREVAWGPIHTLTLGLTGTYLDEREAEFPGIPAVEYKGTAQAGEVYPEWRWVSKVGVAGNDWTLAWKVRYYDESKDFFRPANLTDDAEAEEIYYHDLIATYDWNHLQFVIGLDNATDKDPPRFHSAFNANTEPGTYDVYGRRLWGQVTWSF